MPKNLAIILIAAASAVGLLLGTVIGWFGHQRYLAGQLEAAFSDAADAIAEDFDDMADDDLGETSRLTDGPPEGDPDDGAFTYTATDVKSTGTYRDDSCGETVKAVGEHVVIKMEAENTGRAPATPPSGSYDHVYAYDADGVQFSVHSDICGYADETNPGNSTKYELVFDVPEGTELTALELGSDAGGDIAVVELG
ncbi:hypothetical protein HNR23_004251 [Nocardiopsis mwathae]|uniref:DUF4352 domain-containing protein n=1 Tax=Nocardiopsis mwathae TaxID=1472723 RepID=A0A7W9YN82_9ACTN|nr:hypothetical protein [Nocardiopsis mwathae]MBB6174191.1 hypothetical protein [Nocardiopsis mwathae]